MYVETLNNSRIGSKHDFFRNDDVNSCFDDPDNIPDEYHSRATFDTKSNNFDTKLLDICKSTGMRIVNGRVGEDQGPFTFISRNGASVVDDLLCKECFFSNIMCFNVNSMNEWSDHTPDDNEYSLKWSQVHRDSVRANLSGQVRLLNQ